MEQPADTSETVKPPKKSPFFYGCVGLLAIPALVLLFALLAYFFRENAARKEMNAKLDEIRSRGYPVDNASLGTYYESLTDKRHSEEWLEIIEEVTSDRFNTAAKDVPYLSAIEVEDIQLEQPWQHEEVSRQFLDEHRGLVQRVVRLSLKQLEPEARGVQLPIEFDSFNTLLPNTQNMRQVARLLRLQTDLSIIDRNSAGTRRNVLALLGNANTLRGEPFPVSQLVSKAIEGIALSELKLALELDVLQEKDLKILLEEVQRRTGIDSSWRESLIGERAAAIEVFNGNYSAGVGPALSPARDCLVYLDIIEQALQSPTDEFDELLAALNKVEQEVQAISNAGPLQMLESRITLLISPAISGYGQAYVRLATQNRLAAVAIGLRLYEKRYGSFPADLEELQQLEDVDLSLTKLKPLGPAPFGYQREEIPSSSAELEGRMAAVLWGFDTRTIQKTPQSPPTAESDEMWVYRLQPGPASIQPPGETQPNASP